MTFKDIVAKVVAWVKGHKKTATTIGIVLGSVIVLKLLGC